MDSIYIQMPHGGPEELFSVADLHSFIRGGGGAKQIK